MKNIYFTVGPSQLHNNIQRYTQDALDNDIFSVSHTGNFFTSTYKELTSNLKTLLDIPSDYHVFFTGSSTESMHVALASTVEHRSLHLITGGFSEKFHDAATSLNKRTDRIVFPRHQESIDIGTIDINDDVELVCITENDTSIGMRTPLENVKKLRKNNPSVLVAVDVVSSMPFTDLPYKDIDIAFFSVHKGFGLPAGLGVMIVNDRAIEKAATLKLKGLSIGGHHSLVSLAEKESALKTPETPNVFAIHLLNKVTQDFLERGIREIRKETNTKADLLYDFFENHAVLSHQPPGHFLIASFGHF